MAIIPQVFPIYEPDSGNDKSLSQELQSRAKALAEIAVALVGLAYLSGFLVIYTFQNRFGIHDPNSEFLRIRYIHTGLLCLAFPLFVVTPVTAHVWMFFEQRRHKPDYERARSNHEIVGRSHLPYTFQLMCVSVCLFVYVAFEPYGEFHAHLLWVAILMVLVVAPLRLFPRWVGFTAIEEHPYLRILFASMSAFCLWLALRGTFHHLWFIFLRGSSYWVFTGALTYYLTNTLKKDIKFWYPGQEEGVHLARWAIIVTLSILSILSFAYRVFPYIPADKGGGDFLYSRDAHVCMLADGRLPIDLEPIDSSGCSQTVKILEITESTVYVARINSEINSKQEQASMWQPYKGSERWSDGEHFPTIYAIARSKVGFIQYQLPSIY